MIVVSLLGFSGIGLLASQESKSPQNQPKKREALNYEKKDSLPLSRSVSQELLRRSGGVKEQSKIPMVSSVDAMKKAMVPQDYGYLFPGSGNLPSPYISSQTSAQGCPSGASFHYYFYGVPFYEVP